MPFRREKGRRGRERWRERRDAERPPLARALGGRLTRSDLAFNRLLDFTPQNEETKEGREGGRNKERRGEERRPTSKKIK